MRIKEIEHGLELCKPSPGYVRTPGLHASDLYNALYKAVDPKRYDKKDKAGNAVPFDLTKMEIGTTFEEILEPALAQRLIGERPGEFTAPHADGCTYENEPLAEGAVCPECGAGTIFSPDHLFDVDGELVLGEFKCTYYSTTGAPTDPKFNKWWTQIKIYCHWLNLRRARLYVMFVCGDYKPPSPQLRAWDVKFTTQELHDEYNTVIRFARKKGLLVAK